MRIIARAPLNEFSVLHPDAKGPLDAWWLEAKKASWKTPADIKAMYGSASVVGGNRVVFNIAGNKYRLIVKFEYRLGVGYIRFIGTHVEYDAIDAEKV